mmetsp:Transcript_17266/g.43073  ORF Transcript_17266/g.43073 Transcript_17266/m.43073 type:complete len:563 (+) Transcript_17266:115-1803(+)
MVSSRYLRASIVLLAIESSMGFAPPLVNTLVNTKSRRKMRMRRDTCIVLSNEIGSGKEKENDPADVYVSPMNKDDMESLSNNEKIIDVESTSEPTQKPSFSEKTDYDVVVVGAGCAGVGTALMLTRTFGLDTSRVLLVEQGKQIGESFRHWPEEMRFISPSFNQQGWTESFDLNAIHYDTSPAFMLRSEHPSGKEYAIYLEAIAEQGNLQVSLETKVVSITDTGKKDNDENFYPGPFDIDICRDNDRNKISTRYVVWAAGEFQFPRDQAKNAVNEKELGSKIDSKIDLGSIASSPMSFPGANLCLHNSKIDSWAKLPGDDFIVVGGYESGIDAAVNLARARKKCKVLASTPCWNVKTGDPSTELAPYTSDRLRSVLANDFSPQPKLFAPLRVIAVEDLGNGEFGVAAKWKTTDDGAPPSTYTSSGFRAEVPGDSDSIKVFRTKNPPILCTGFEGSVAAQASHLFAFPDPNANKKGCVGDGPLLTKNDESTKVKGVFLVGPAVTHGELSFCFVYKFRQRFAVVANAICEGLGMDTATAVAECRRTNMYLDNFLTCEDTCGDSC